MGREGLIRSNAMRCDVFVSADRLLAIERGEKMHAISFDWDEYAPHFLTYSSGSRELKEIALDEVSFTVSDEQYCIGSFRLEGYRPCPFGRRVINFAQCEFCSRSIIPIQRCLFDPICEGELCNWDLCRREHVVYIAFYGNKTKVGMTSKGRITERLIEQGADAYFAVGTFPSRKAAREMEKRISSELSIAQMHRSAHLMGELQKGPDYDAVKRAYRTLAPDLEDRFQLSPSDVVLLNGYPISQPLESTPAYADLTGIHEGKVIGVKGRILLYRNSGIKALNMAALPSRLITLI